MSVSWKPTGRLRYATPEDDNGGYTLSGTVSIPHGPRVALQQEWESPSGEREWRFVPFERIPRSEFEAAEKRG